MTKSAGSGGILLAAVFCASLAGGADLSGIPGKIELRIYPKRPVTFDHQGHAKRIGNCRKCHHMSTPGEEERCFECHKAKRDGDTPSFREAMHYRCKSCHMRDGKKVKGACRECHKEISSSKP